MPSGCNKPYMCEDSCQKALSHETSVNSGNGDVVQSQEIASSSK